MTNRIIDEVRKNREQYAASFDFDLDRIFVDVQLGQKKRAAQGAVIIAAPTVPPSQTSLDLRRVRFARP